MSNSAVSRSRGAFFMPGVSISQFVFPFSLSSSSHFHSFFPFSSPPPRCGAASHRFRAPDQGGWRSAGRRPGAALSTRCACHDRHAGHHKRRPCPERGGAPPALHRGDFWFAQRIAACGIPFGLVPASVPLLISTRGDRVRATDLPHGSYRPEGPLRDLPGPVANGNKPGQPRPRSALQERLMKAPLKSQAGHDLL